MKNIQEGGRRLVGYPVTRDEKKPVITVITAVYNGINNIENTIQSILNQNYPNIEYIVIDGGSSDGTVDILKKYTSRIDYWVSEKDNGISDAFNKGIKLATGDYINFQGDGDGFVRDNSISELFTEVTDYNYGLICARIQRIDLKGNILYVSKRWTRFCKSSLLLRMSIPHQGLFTHRSLFFKYGLFDTANKFCMDYDHLLRMYHSFPSVSISNIVVANWRADGIGTGREREILREYHKIKKDNQVASKGVLGLINSYIVFKFYLKKLLNK